MAFAEAEAQRRGHARVELYTNARMTENIALFGRLGFRETDQRHEAGFDRVFMSKHVV